MVLPPRAYKFIGLNAVRTLSIIALLLVFSSNIVIMVEDIKAVRKGDKPTVTTTDDAGNEETFECDYFDGSTVPNQAAGAFWAVLNRLFILGITILSVLSELSIPATERFFAQFFPVLGPDFGVGILGAIQWITSASILSHHVDTFPLVAAWLLFAVGCINILLGIAFRKGIKVDRSLSTFKEAKAKELLPGPVQHAVPNFKILETSVGSIFEKGDIARTNTGKSDVSDRSFGGYGFGRQGEKAAGLKGFMISRPIESLPRYAPQRPRSQSPTRSEPDNRI